MFERQYAAKVKRIRTDNGTEFISKITDSNTKKTLPKWFEEQGILVENSAPYAHAQNGISERANRTGQDKARSLLIGAYAPLTLWNKALRTAIYLANRSPTKPRNPEIDSLKKITPYEILEGHRPDLSGLRRFGCTAYVYKKPEKSEKFKARS